MGRLGDALRRMRYRPQAANVPLPVVFAGVAEEAGLTGEQRRTAAAELADAVVAGAEGTPYGHLEPKDRLKDMPYKHAREPVMHTAELLREGSREISTTSRGRFEPPIRFPLLSLLLRLLELGPLDEKALRRQLWQRSVVVPGTRASDAAGTGEPPRVADLLTYVEVIVPPAVTLLALVSATFAQIVDLTWALSVAAIGLVLVLVQLYVASRDRAGRWRFRWFTRQPFLKPSREDRRRFLVFAARFARGSELAGQSEQVELLLVHAFLEDLRRAYHRRPYRRAPWARRVQPLLLLGGVGDGDPKDRLVRLIDRVRRETLQVDPLLVVAVGTDAPRPLELFPPEDPGSDVDTAAGLLDGWAETGRTAERFGSRRSVEVVMTVADIRREVEPADLAKVPRRPWLAGPLLPWMLTAAVVLGSGAFVVVEQARYCDPPGVWRTPDGDCVGISDGSFAFHERLRSITDVIEAENAEVEASGQPSITIVYFAPMTPSGGSTQPNLLAGVHGELAGVAAQQRDFNDTSDLPKIKMLLASPGSRSMYAERVTEQVIRRANDDPSIVGVVGFGQSTAQTQAAIKLMSAAGLPMVSTVSTYENLSQVQPGRQSPYFFRLAPGNSRLAAQAAVWAYEGRLDAPGRPAAGPARSALVFSDNRPGQLYGQDLGRRFAEAFDARPGTEVRRQPYTDTSDFSARLNENCGEDGERTPDVIYYAGRSDEFLSFYNALGGSACDPRRFVLTAGDDVTKYVSDNQARLAAGRIRFFYTPLALPTGTEDFRFQQILSETGLAKAEHRLQPSRAHAAMGYDALKVTAEAARDTYRDQNRTLPRAGALLYPLSRLAPVYGLSGYIKFDTNRMHGQETVDKAVLLVTVPPSGELRLVTYCGRRFREESPRPDCASS